MNFPDSVEFLYALGNEAKTLHLGLERMHEIAARLGNPERSLKFVHVAGTNGKGSVCAMIESGLRGAGHSTGLYTSPHLVSPTERIQIEGEPVSEAEFARAFNVVHEAARGMEQHPTYFETVTAMALFLFAERRVDWVVWEVGLGGRLDATNIVTPALCVITPISLDHQSYLGDTVSKIATEKAGILKPGVPAVIAEQTPDAMREIEARGVPLYHSRDAREFPPPLLGKHQVENTRTAVRALEVLGVDPAGIAGTKWPGRLELVRRSPDTYLDGAHNLAGAAALAEFIHNIKGARRVWMVFGVMRDKPIEQIGELLFPLADELILVTPHSPRARDASEIPAPHARIAASVPEALAMTHAAAPSDLIFITGSLYLIGEARPLLVS
ncbi:MAG: folylpolyglutamate synthase/dihydrofolate synthase family protein [Bryobacteraceae bacterium]|nr:folylpolyglutamate synthase/dihydrofolate synthase family protein [Bryobacteraceae bacterium]